MGPTSAEGVRDRHRAIVEGVMNAPNQGFDELFDRLFPVIAHTVVRIVDDRAEAEDVAAGSCGPWASCVGVRRDGPSGPVWR
jgi:hypothetical protein